MRLSRKLKLLQKYDKNDTDNTIMYIQIFKNLFVYFFEDILLFLLILPLFFPLKFDFPLPPNVLSVVFSFMPLFLPPNPYLVSFPFLLCCDL